MLMHEGKLVDRSAAQSTPRDPREDSSLEMTTSVSRRSALRAKQVLKFVQAHGLEGRRRQTTVIAFMSPASGQALWSKYRVNLGQEFVVGGYTPGTHGFDALIVGVFRGSCSPAAYGQDSFPRPAAKSSRKLKALRSPNARSPIFPRGVPDDGVKAHRGEDERMCVA